jgi:hypothetical protein
MILAILRVAHLLQEVPNEGGDMAGLRLGLSANLAPYAHRLYCRFLGKERNADSEALAISWKYDRKSIAKIEHWIADIRTIASGLKDAPHIPQGLLLPNQFFR